MYKTIEWSFLLQSLRLLGCKNCIRWLIFLSVCKSHVLFHFLLLNSHQRETSLHTWKVKTVPISIILRRYYFLCCFWSIWHSTELSILNSLFRKYSQNFIILNATFYYIKPCLGNTFFIKPSLFYLVVLFSQVAEEFREDCHFHFGVGYNISKILIFLNFVSFSCVFLGLEFMVLNYC